MKRSTAVVLLYGCVLLQQQPCGASESLSQKRMPPPPPPPRPPLSSTKPMENNADNSNSGDKEHSPKATTSAFNDGNLPVARQSLVESPGRLPPPPPPPPLRAMPATNKDDDDQRLLYTPPETGKPPPPPPRFERAKYQESSLTQHSAQTEAGAGERPPPPPPPPSATRQTKLSHVGPTQDRNDWNSAARPPPPKPPLLSKEQDSKNEQKETRNDVTENQVQKDDKADFKYSPTNTGDDDHKSRTIRNEFATKPPAIQSLVEPNKRDSIDARDSDGLDEMKRAREESAEKTPAGFHDETRPNPPRMFDPSRVPPPPQGYFQRPGPPSVPERDSRATLVPPQSGPGAPNPQLQQPPPVGRQPNRQPPNQQQFSNRPPHPPVQQQQRSYAGQRIPPPPQATTTSSRRPPPYNKADPRLLYNQASARRKEAAPPPTWRRLLRRIEGSLDGLANLEDTLGGKARQLYSSTVDTAAVTVARTSKVLKSHGKPSSSRTPPLAKPQMPRRPVPPATRTTTTAQQQQQQPSLADRVARKTDPQFAAKILSATPEKRTTEAPPQQQPESRPINWEDVMHKKTRKVIRANGGASHPTDTGFRPANNADVTSHPMSGPPKANPAGQDQKPPLAMKQAFPSSDLPAAPSYRPPRPADRPNPKSPASLDNDDDSTSWKDKFSALIPSMPRFHFGRSHLQDYSSTVDAWKADDEAFNKPKKGFLGLFSKRDDDTLPLYIEARRPKDHSSVPEKVPATLTRLGEKCNMNRSFALLTEKDWNVCNSLGRSRSFWDMATLLFFFLGVRCLPIYSGTLSPGQPVGQYAEAGLQFMTDVAKSWAPFALAAAILSSLSSQLLFEKQAKGLASQRRESIAEEVQYGRLFLRLFTSESTPRRTMKQVGSAVYEQVLAKVELSRLRNFVSLAILTIAIVAVRFIQPIFESVGSASLQILELKEIRQWPPEWKLLWDTLKSSATPLVQMIFATLQDVLSSLKDNPLRFTYEASIVLSLFMASLIPSMELKRKLTHPKSEDDEDEVIAENFERFTNEVSALGISSSTRLSLLTESVEGTLERWRLAQPPEVSDESAGLPVSSFVRMCAYGLLGTGLLLVPVMVYANVGILPSTARNQIIRWDSLFDLAVVLYFVQSMVWTALKGTFKAKRAESLISGFMASVRAAIEERSKQLESPAMNLRLQASISPTAGLNVRDLWAAHATKRAWAVRGANLACRSGELLLILGDESAGKTRLLTTIAEAFLSPPRASRTVTRINRGSISLGGLDVSKWDATSLRKRLGVVLNDVRASSDRAKVLSGMTMEEILEPYDGLRTVDPSHAPSKTERACITQALHITGLNASLLPRLPSKMSTVVTGNEEDLKPSPFRPHAVLLSPVEWAKVQLARVLSQTIFDNDSTTHSGDKFENCMVGSLLLLDDVSAGLSEIEEGRLLKNLRKTGAATVVTSNRWAAGRWADKIVVVRDGVIVESGTHAELLTRGAQKSVYASNWHAMTSTV